MTKEQEISSEQDIPSDLRPTEIFFPLIQKEAEFSPETLNALQDPKMNKSIEEGD